MLITLQLILVLLINVNEFLFGNSKNRIRIILVFSNLFIILLLFIIYDWLYGLAFVCGSIIWAILTTKLARYIAFKIVGIKIPTQTNQQNEINDFLKGDISLAELIDDSDEGEKNHKINMIFEKEDMKEILKEFSKTPNDLKIYEILLSDIFLEIISDTKKLRKLLEIEKKGLSHTEITYKMRQVW